MAASKQLETGAPDTAKIAPQPTDDAPDQMQAEKDAKERTQREVQHMSKEQLEQYQEAACNRLAGLLTQQNALRYSSRKFATQGDVARSQSYRELILKFQPQISEAREWVSIYQGKCNLEERVGKFDESDESDDPAVEVFNLLRCETTYSFGLEHIFITGTDETGTYAINGKARQVAASRGWIDGFRKFSPEQMQILLQIGLTKCNRR